MSAPERSPLVSVCILAGHGATALEACLESLEAQRGAPPFELLIGGNPSATSLSAVRRRFPAAQVCRTGRRHPGGARNPLIARARGDLLLFLDDDVTVPAEMLASLAAMAERYPEVSVFGGPNETPPGSSRFQYVQGAVLSSAMGAGPVSRRYGARHAGPADERWFTLCNLAIRRQTMLPFLDRLVCAEENALLAELRHRGALMRYDPALRVRHARRATPRSFAAQMLKYGRGRGELIGRHPGTIRLAYLAPAMLLLYFLLLLPALLLLGVSVPLALVPGWLYLGLSGATALWIAWTLRRPLVTPLAWLLMITVHVCYGTGVMRGISRPGRARLESSTQWSTAGVPAAETAGTEITL